MIIDDQTNENAASPVPVGTIRAGNVLAACVTEANRHARAITALDRAVGESLGRGGAGMDREALQMLDLLRQEAQGLAQALQLATSLPLPDGVIDSDALATCAPLAAQRTRLMY